MGQITKAFAENLLSRTKEGQHINTTVDEEAQLIRGWLYWHQHEYEPRMKRIIEMQNVGMGGGIAGAEAMTSGGSGWSTSASSEQEWK